MSKSFQSIDFHLDNLILILITIKNMYKYDNLQIILIQPTVNRINNNNINIIQNSLG